MTWLLHNHGCASDYEHEIFRIGRKSIYLKIVTLSAVVEERRNGGVNRVDPITTFVDVW